MNIYQILSIKHSCPEWCKIIALVIDGNICYLLMDDSTSSTDDIDDSTCYLLRIAPVINGTAIAIYRW